MRDGGRYQGEARRRAREHTGRPGAGRAFRREQSASSSPPSTTSRSSSRELAEAGVDLVGENRAEDLVEKQELFGDRFEWHFIGHLQSRKAKVVVPRVTLVHSVDSVR